MAYHEYTMIIQVAGEDGENCVSISKVSDADMEVMYPILEEIKRNKGYFTRGSYVKPGKPSGRDLYRSFAGWDVLSSHLPDPPSGFFAVLEIKLFRDNPWEMILVD